MPLVIFIMGPGTSWLMRVFHKAWAAKYFMLSQSELGIVADTPVPLDLFRVLLKWIVRLLR